MSRQGEPKHPTVELRDARDFDACRGGILTYPLLGYLIAFETPRERCARRDHEADNGARLRRGYLVGSHVLARNPHVQNRFQRCAMCASFTAGRRLALHAHWMPAFWVPALLVTHYVVLVLLGKRWIGPM